MFTHAANGMGRFPNTWLPEQLLEERVEGGVVVGVGNVDLASSRDGSLVPKVRALTL